MHKYLALVIPAALILFAEMLGYSYGAHAYPSISARIIQETDATGDNEKPLPPCEGKPFFGNILRAWLIFSNESLIKNKQQVKQEPQYIWAEKLIKNEKLTHSKVDLLIQKNAALEADERLLLRALIDWHPWRERSRIKDRWITLGWNMALAIPKSALASREALFSFIQIYCGLILIETDAGIIVEHLVPQYISTMARVPKTMKLIDTLVTNKVLRNIRVIMVSPDKTLTPLYLGELVSAIKKKYPKCAVTTCIVDKPQPDSVDHLMYNVKSQKLFRASVNGFGYMIFRKTENLWNVLPDLSRPFLAEVALVPVNLSRVTGSTVPQGKAK